MTYLNSRIDQLIAQSNQKAQAIGKAKALIEVDEQKRRILERQLEQINQKIIQLKNQLTEKRRKFDDAQEQIEEKDQNIERLENEVQGLENIIDKLEQTIDQICQRIDSLLRDIDQNKTDLEQVTEKILQMQAELASLGIQIQAAEEKLNQLQYELDNAKGKKNKKRLNTKIRSLKTKLNELKNRRKKFEDAISELIAKRSNISQTINSLMINEGEEERHKDNKNHMKLQKEENVMKTGKEIKSEEGSKARKQHQRDKFSQNIEQLNGGIGQLLNKEKEKENEVSTIIDGIAKQKEELLVYQKDKERLEQQKADLRREIQTQNAQIRQNTHSFKNKH